MPQLVKRRRSGRAILAAGALVASLVAAGARPAGAVETVADHATPVTACVGDATADWMFDDVSAGHYFRDAINCLAYYGVTIGYGDGTFRPSRDVSRFEMVLFMERSARIAGADPATVVADFATAGSDPVNRADMALLIARLLAAATSNDSRVNVVLESDGTFTVGGAEPDDAFIDSRQSQPVTKDSAASALFELGVAKGTGGGNFSPEGLVTRGEMAAFITRALAHTTARPDGVSIQQYLPGEVTVSVRDEAFAPVANADLDIFSIATPDARRAFRSDGSCSSLVTDESGGRSCEIDGLDPVTGPDGDLTIGLTFTDEPELTVWAWTGELGDIIRRGDTGLASAEVSTQGVEATGAKVSNSLPENATHIRFGRTVTVTVQLVGVNGLRAVPSEEGASYTISREAYSQIDGTATISSNLRLRITETVEVDSTGKIEFILDGADPDSNDTGDADEILWRYSVTPVDQSPQLDEPVNNVEVVFTDADPVATTVDLATQVKYLRAARPGSQPVSNVVIATVTDQYGQPFRGATVQLESSSGSFSVPGTVRTGSTGTARIAYQHSGTGGTRETLEASLEGVSGGPTGTVDFLWAADPEFFGFEETTDGGRYEVLAADPRRNEVVVDLGFDQPAVVVYDGNDRFRLDGTIVSLSLFESVLANELDGDSILLLGWSSRDPDNQADRTDWYLVT